MSFDHSFPSSTANNVGKVLVWNTQDRKMQVFSDLSVWAAQSAPVLITETRRVRLHLRNGSHELTHPNICVTNTCEVLPRCQGRTGAYLTKLTIGRWRARPGSSRTKDIMGLPLLLLWRQVFTLVPNVLMTQTFTHKIITDSLCPCLKWRELVLPVSIYYVHIL